VKQQAAVKALVRRQRNGSAQTFHSLGFPAELEARFAPD
jgi:hypothetical protein